MILKHCRPGAEVLTPLGRPAVILRVMTGSNKDNFVRVNLRYVDVKEDTWMGSHLVALQPKLLRGMIGKN